jgi:hypothetical protein
LSAAAELMADTVASALAALFAQAH